MRPIPRAALALLAAGLLAAAGCGGRGGTPRNLILVSVDTLRPDHLGCYGHPEARTPFWDRMARRGAQFRTALTSAPFTLPSHATILSGVYPFSHGARQNGTRAFDAPGLTLPEELRRADLHCAAVTASAVLDSSTGLTRGFEHFEWRDRPGEAERGAAAVTRAARKWVSALAPEDRFFLFLHLYDPHDPYDPIAPWGRILASPYDGEIAACDRALSRLFQQLDADGRLDLTMVVALSDHGEAFGEHGEEGHGFFVYDTTLRIPLVLWGPTPFRGGAVREDVARTLDVLPTVLRSFRIGPDWRLPGRTLQEHEPEDPLEFYAESFEAALRFGASDLRTLRAENWKLIRAPRAELYDLDADPEETRNLLAEEPDRAAGMRARLAELLGPDLARPAGLGGDGGVDEDRAEELAALGYASGGALPEAGADLRDPKDLVGLPALLDRAAEVESGGEWEAASALAGKILEKDPGNRVGWRLRARERAAGGAPEDAADVWARAVEAHPESAGLWAEYGSDLLRLGRSEEARNALRKSVRLDGASSAARLQLAMAALATGMPRVAWKEVTAVLEREPDNALAKRMARELKESGAPRPE